MKIKFNSFNYNSFKIKNLYLKIIKIYKNFIPIMYYYNLIKKFTINIYESFYRVS